MRRKFVRHARLFATGSFATRLFATGLFDEKRQKSERLHSSRLSLQVVAEGDTVHVI